MSLYAASNIAEAVAGFKEDGYARFGGLIQNSRGVAGEDGLVDKAAAEMGSRTVYRVPRSPTVQECEARLTTVVSGAPESAQADEYRRLAQTLYDLSEDVAGAMRLGPPGGCDC